MEILIFLLAAYLIYGLIYAHVWSKEDGMGFYWPMIFIWPLWWGAIGICWLLDKTGFRIH